MSIFHHTKFSVCVRGWREGEGVRADDEDGPLDGVNHVHPEKPFSEVCFSNPFSALYLH